MDHPILGPRTLHLSPGVHLDVGEEELRLRTDHALDDLATGSFSRPSSYVAFRPSAARGADEARFGGYSWTQFGLPVYADSGLDFPFRHGEVLVSPAVVFPLFAQHPRHGALLLAPLDHFHEQVLAIREGELRWGWHGDLDRIPPGFSTRLAIYQGPSIRQLLWRWGAALREQSGVAPPDRYADVSTSHLSYWTDNGAAYWYRCEPGRDIATTLVDKMAELKALDVPVRGVELDSWFYPHEKTRPIQEIGYLDTVPPTGMMRWEPREDLLPEGIEALRKAMGSPPLILHSRHVSAQSPYLDEGEWWVHLGNAHPVDGRLFERFMADARRWGASCYEQDWMWVIFFAIAQIRAEPGRARAWQSQLDRAARAEGLALIWCMATPADMAEATRLPAVVAIRTSDDYRFADDPALLWRWYLVVGALARALGLPAFKDVFFSHEGGDIDGDPHPEIEALLSALSAGPVGIGDRLGRTDPQLVARTCRSDGLLVKPDLPIAALDHCLFDDPKRGLGVLWADTRSGPWRYLLALHVAETGDPIEDALVLDDRVLVYDFRNESAEPGATVQVQLTHRDHAYFVLCPIADGCALIGDKDRFATMGDRRIEPLGPRRARVLGGVGERVTVRWWCETRGLVDVETEVGTTGRVEVSLPDVD